MRRGLIAPRTSGAAYPWEHDWSAYASYYDWTLALHNVPATTWHEIFNQAGAGVLYFVRAGAETSALAADPAIRLTVDGVARTFAGHDSIVRAGNVILQPIPFKTSLRLEVYNRSGAAQDLWCGYTYLLQTGTPDPSKCTILDAPSRNMEYRESTGAYDDVVSVPAGAGWLLGLEWAWEYLAGTGTITAQVTVDGVLAMNKTLIGTLGGICSRAMFVGPVRFATSLLVRVNGDDPDGHGHGRCWYLLDA